MKRFLAGGVLLVFCFACEAGGQVQDSRVTPQEVSRAVEKGVEFIRSRQLPDGSWPYTTPEHVQGAAALAVLALSEAGVDEDDPAIVKGLEFVLRDSFTQTYDAGCAAMAFESVNAGKYIKGIAAARDFIVSAQNARGMWSYTLGNPLRTVGDNSNTQFAVLGLRAAMLVGLDVPPQTLGLCERHYGTSQNADGGWGYRPGDNSYGSMTAAGVASLYILGGRLYVESNVCGQYRQDPRIAAGLSWLVKNYNVTTNPAKNSTWLFYYLYALERVGVLTGFRDFGAHDWYLDGCRSILDAQNADGSWRSGRDQIPNTCFALLFLSKGNVPVLINKLAHSGEWDADIHDAANLSAFISYQFGQRMGWQAVSLDDDVDALLSAPVLYVTGHTWPEFSAEQKATLNEFFERGGFMFAEACCGRKEFDQGFRRFTAEMFPDFRLERLDRTHPVYRSCYNLSNSMRSLEGVLGACRTPVIYSSKDFSCAWERGRYKDEKEAFEFGANIAAYATGKQPLKPKLEQKSESAKRVFKAAAPGAFTFAQVSYAGLWNPHPVSGTKLLAFLNETAGLPVASGLVTLPLTDPNLGNYPFIYMTGLDRFVLTDDEKKALGSYLRRGGFLFADASAGRGGFDESFRALMAEVLASSPLEELSPDSRIYHMAFDTRKVTYTAMVREQNPDLDTLTLYGAKVDERVAVVYSPYDIGCALSGYAAYGSRGLIPADALKAAANIVLFALTY